MSVMRRDNHTFTTMTSRELADAIDELICVRVKMATNSINQPDGSHAEQEAAEVLVRRIADAFKNLDARQGGVACYGPNE